MQAAAPSLDLSGQGLTEQILFEGDVSGQLELLDASQKRLCSICPQHTRQLVLARNKLQRVSGLASLSHLCVLDLSRNRLQDLEQLQALSALTELDVHHNRLTSLAGITQLRQLASINVAANQLQVLPNLAALSALTQLNLKHNRLQCLVATAEPVPSPSGVTCRQHQRQQQQQLESNVAAAPATEAIPAAGGNACSSSASQHNQLLLLLPSSLKRLSLACNNIQQLADLSPLQQLPLLDLCVDGNPFTAPSRQPQLADRASGGGFGPGGGVGGGPGVGRQWYREAVLAAACNPCLLMLDGQPVSPAERVHMLTTAHKLAGEGAAAAAAAAAASRPNTSTAHQHLYLQGLALDGEQLLPIKSESTQPCAASAGHHYQQQEQHKPHKQQQQLGDIRGLLNHQTSLQHAADVCGVDTGSPNSQQQQQQQQQKQQPSTRADPKAPADGHCDSSSPWPGPAAAPAAPAAPAAAAAAVSGVDVDGCVVYGQFISEQELEERYLKASRARLARRGVIGQDTSSSPPPHVTPGAELHGNRCVLAGGGGGTSSSSNLLRLLQGDAYAGVSDLTLSHMAYTEVVAAIPLLQALRRLRRLALSSIGGLCRLPQLHPLLLLKRLQHLAVEGRCPVGSLVLLRPYVTFRFPGLQTFNGTPITPTDLASAANLFGALEANLAVALDSAPQQAALAAAGLVLPNTTGTQGLAAAALPYAPAAPASAANRAQPQAVVNAPPCVASKILGEAAESAAGANSSRAWLVASPTAAATATAAAAAAAVAASSRVSQVFAQMRGPLLPPAAVVEQGQQFAKQLLAEAAVVQQQLGEFEEVVWPGLVERSIHEALTGHSSGHVQQAA